MKGRAVLNFATYDVFTERRYGGNPLAIVEEAGGLNTAQMQTIAREFNLSETIFVMPPRDPAHTARVRIFFPTAEIPFAGHPTIGCAVHLATRMHGEGDFDALLVLEEEAGPVPVRVVRQGAQVIAELQAPVLPHSHAGEVDANRIALATGLDRAEIGFKGHAPALFAGGPAFLFVPVSSRDALRRARAIEPHWSEVMAAGDVDSAYLYCRRDGGFSARMFSPTAGIPEDPATGSASAILAGQLRVAGELAEGPNTVRLRQGEDMGRPSEITLRIDFRKGSIVAVHVAGTAVAVMEGRLAAPPAIA